MKLRYYTALVTGALAEIATAALLWIATDIPLYGIAFWSVLAYFNGIAVTLHVTEPRKRRHRKMEGPTIYTLTTDGWKRETGRNTKIEERDQGHAYGSGN